MVRRKYLQACSPSDWLLFCPFYSVNYAYFAIFRQQLMLPCRPYPSVTSLPSACHQLYNFMLEILWRPTSVLLYVPRFSRIIMVSFKMVHEYWLDVWGWSRSTPPRALSNTWRLFLNFGTVIWSASLVIALSVMRRILIMRAQSTLFLNAWQMDL